MPMLLLKQPMMMATLHCITVVLGTVTLDSCDQLIVCLIICLSRVLSIFIILCT